MTDALCYNNMWRGNEREDVSWFRPEPWLGRAACIRLETMAGGSEVWAAVSPEEMQPSALNKAHIFLRYISSQLAKRRMLRWTRYITRNKMGRLRAENGFEVEVVVSFIRVPS
jgi:hypothetical protein